MILFAKSEIIGGIVPNQIAFSLFLGATGYFTLTEKMAEIFGIRKRPKSVYPPPFERRLLSEPEG